MFHEFLECISKSGAPPDFFSWHSCAETAFNIRMDRYVYDELCKYGYGDMEIHLTEWDPYYNELGTAHHSAEIAAMQELNITGVDLSNARYHVIDQERMLSWSPAVKEIENNQVFLIEW